MILTVFGVIIYSVLGFLYKMTVYKSCNIKNTLFIAFLFSLFLSIFIGLFYKSLVNPLAVAIGIIGGISIYLAIYCYIKSLTLGKRIASWIIFKMSLIIAIAISIFLWGEKPTSNQIIGFSLMLLAIIFLGIDMRIKVKQKNVD